MTLTIRTVMLLTANNDVEKIIDRQLRCIFRDGQTVHNNIIVYFTTVQRITETCWLGVNKQDRPREK